MTTPKRQRQQRAQQRDHDGRCCRRFVGLAPVLQHLGVFLVGQVQIFGGILHPRGGVFLQIENLQLGNRGIAGVHFFALVHQGLGKFPGPVLLGLLYLRQRRFAAARSWPGSVPRLQSFLQHRGCRRSCDRLRGYRRSAGSCSDRAGSASSETGSCRWCPPFAGPAKPRPWRCARAAPRPGSRKQHHDHGQHGAEVQVEFLANRHCCSSACCFRIPGRLDRTAKVSGLVLGLELEFHRSAALGRRPVQISTSSRHPWRH